MSAELKFSAYHEGDTPTHDMTQALLNYWTSKLDGQLMPQKSAFDPIEIPSLLPHIGLLDVDRSAGLRFRIRFYGTEIVYAAGEERTGKYIEDFGEGLPEETRKLVIGHWISACTATCEQQRPYFAVGRRTDPIRSFHLLHIAALPLTTNGTEVDQILGLITTEADTVGS